MLKTWQFFRIVLSSRSIQKTFLFFIVMKDIICIWELSKTFLKSLSSIYIYLIIWFIVFSKCLLLFDIIFFVVVYFDNPLKINKGGFKSTFDYLLLKRQNIHFRIIDTSSVKKKKFKHTNILNYAKQVFDIDFDFVTQNLSLKLAVKPWNSPERDKSI